MDPYAEKLYRDVPYLSGWVRNAGYNLLLFEILKALTLKLNPVVTFQCLPVLIFVKTFFRQP